LGSVAGLQLAVGWLFVGLAGAVLMPKLTFTLPFEFYRFN